MASVEITRKLMGELMLDPKAALEKLDVVTEEEDKKKIYELIHNVSLTAQKQVAEVVTRIIGRSDDKVEYVCDPDHPMAGGPRCPVR